MAEETTPLADQKNIPRLSPQARAALIREGIETAEKAAAMSDAELARIRGVKAASISHIRRWQSGEPGSAAPAPRAATESLRREAYLLEIAKGTAPAEARQRADEAVAEYFKEPAAEVSGG